MAEFNSYLFQNDLSSNTSDEDVVSIEKSGSLDSLEEYIFFKHLSNLISRPCSVTYLETLSNHLNVKIEYEKFLDFIENHPEPGKSQLTDIIFPVFVHFYLLLLQISDSSGAGSVKAHKFYDDHAKLFLSAEGYKDILNPLRAAKNVEDVKAHEQLRNFWEMKFVCRTSFDVLKSLKAYMERNKSKALLYVLHFHIYYENIECESINFANIKSPEHGTDESDDQIAKSPSDLLDDSVKSILMEQLEMYSTHISRIVIKYNISCSSVDFNEEGTQISLAPARSFVSVADIPIQGISEELLERLADISFQGISEEPSERLTDVQIHGISEEPLERLTDINVIGGKISLPETVYAVQYIPSKPDMLLASSGTEVKLLNTRTYEVISTFHSTHTSYIQSIDINSSATFFATTSSDSTACLFSFHETEPVTQYVGHADVVNVVKFHPNGIYLATGSADTTIRLWKVHNTLPLRSYVGHKAAILGIAFSPNGKLLASADVLGIITIWDIGSKTEILQVSVYETFELNLARVTSLCFSHDSSMLAACNFKGVLRIWNLKSSKLHITERFKNTPLLIKCNKNKYWTIVFKENIE